MKIIGIEKTRWITMLLKEAKHKTLTDQKRVKVILKNCIDLLEFEIEKHEPKKTKKS